MGQWGSTGPRRLKLRAFKRSRSPREGPTVTVKWTPFVGPRTVGIKGRVAGSCLFLPLLKSFKAFFCCLLWVCGQRACVVQAKRHIHRSCCFCSYCGYVGNALALSTYPQASLNAGSSNLRKKAEVPSSLMAIHYTPPALSFLTLQGGRFVAADAPLSIEAHWMRGGRKGRKMRRLDAGGRAMECEWQGIVGAVVRAVCEP